MIVGSRDVRTRPEAVLSEGVTCPPVGGVASIWTMLRSRRNIRYVGMPGVFRIGHFAKVAGTIPHFVPKLYSTKLNLAETKR